MTTVGSFVRRMRDRVHRLTPVGALWLAWVASRSAMVVVPVHDLLVRPTQLWLPFLITNDVSHDYFAPATQLVAGVAPYRSFAYEYPPGTLPFLAVAHLGGNAVRVFIYSWIALMLALDACALGALCRWTAGRGRGPVWMWVIGVALLGPLALVRNDMIVATAFVIGFWLVATGRAARGGALWGFAVMAKVWPIVPLLMVGVGRRAGRRGLLAGSAAVVVVTLGALVGWRAVGAMFASLDTRHGHRPLEIETSWAVWLTSVAEAHGRHLGWVGSFGSDNLSPRVVPSWVAGLAYGLTEGVQVVGLAAAALLRRRKGGDLGFEVLAWLTLAVVAASLAVAPVTSPQYVLWLLAAVCCVLVCDPGRASATMGVAVGAVAALTQCEFPFLFDRLKAGDGLALTVTGSRDALLVAIAAGGVIAVARRSRGHSSGTRRLPIVLEGNP